MFRCLQNLKCCKSKPKEEILNQLPEVYVLELEDQKYIEKKIVDFVDEKIMN